MVNIILSSHKPASFQPSLRAKIEHKAHPQPAGFQIIEQLSFFVRSNGLNRLEFKDDLIVHHKVRHILLVEYQVLLSDLQRNLGLERNPSQAKLHRQSLLIDCFQETVAQLVIHLHRCADDLEDLLFEQ